MTEAEYDVIIVGSGPAGATVAYYLGQAGWHVLVLEKESLPRYKACGGGVSIKFLNRLFPFSFEPVLDSDIKEMSYVYGRFNSTFSIPTGVVSLVMRSQLDAFILSKAHVEVLQNARLQEVHETSTGVQAVTADGRQLRSRYLIGADGANSVVAHSLGLRKQRRLAAAIEVEATVPPEVLGRFANRLVFIFNEIHKGYLWIFPKADHLSVGIAAYNPRPGELQNVLRKVMRRYQIDLEGIPFHGHPIPIYTRREPIATRRVLLVGDAAGLVDPLSGEGIRYAIKSGHLASRALLSGHPEAYSDLVYRQIGRNHLLAIAVAQIFYNLQSLCLILGAPNPFTTQAILDLLSDQAGTAEIMLRSIATLPVFVVTEILANLAKFLNLIDDPDRIRKFVYER